MHPRTLIISSATTTFSTSDFVACFSDADFGDSLQSIRFDRVPDRGMLELSGVPVTAGQVISVSEIPHLTYQANPSYFGFEFISWGGSDGIVFGADDEIVLNCTRLTWPAPVKTMPPTQGITDPPADALPPPTNTPSDPPTNGPTVPSPINTIPDPPADAPPPSTTANPNPPAETPTAPVGDSTDPPADTSPLSTDTPTAPPDDVTTPPAPITTITNPPVDTIVPTQPPWYTFQPVYFDDPISIVTQPIFVSLPRFDDLVVRIGSITANPLPVFDHFVPRSSTAISSSLNIEVASATPSAKDASGASAVPIVIASASFLSNVADKKEAHLALPYLPEAATPILATMPRATLNIRHFAWPRLKAATGWARGKARLHATISADFTTRDPLQPFGEENRTSFAG
jgi:hypothetical protein